MDLESNRWMEGHYSRSDVHSSTQLNCYGNYGPLWTHSHEERRNRRILLLCISIPIHFTIAVAHNDDDKAG